MNRIPPSIGPLSAPPADEPPVAEPARQGFSSGRLGRWLLLLMVLPVVISLALVMALRWLPPPTSAFMLQSEVRPVQYRWVPASAIAETLRTAAVAAEDQKFWTHHGFDLEAIEKALEHNQKSRRKHGASTISQQVAKNLFLWPGRSYLRKGVEVSFTVAIELLWPKQRILEVYLNVAEFGPGIYGVEAAAQKFFGKPAARLLPAEAAQLAAVLPNPRKWRADRPGPYVQARSVSILRLMGYRPAQPAPAEEPEEPPLDLPDEPAPAPDAYETPDAQPAEQPPPAAAPETGAPEEAPPEEAAPEESPPLERASLRPRSV